MTPPRLIADINVLLPGMAGTRATLAERLYRQFYRGNLRFIFSSSYLDELERVVDYPRIERFNLTRGQTLRLVRNLYDFGEYLPMVPKYDWPSLTDKKDWYLLNLLVEAKTDGLITQDKKVLAAGQKLEMPVFDLQGGAAKGWY
jgi:putative PIN family toxin of toxin-antitoxin system